MNIKIYSTYVFVATRYLITACFMAAIYSCSFAGVIEDKVVNAVDSYCRTPESSRKALRTTVNAKLAPNKVLIECASDE